MNKRKLLVAALACAIVSATAPAAELIPYNIDGANEGYNDTTAIAPEGLNPGTTKGEQRMIVAQFAADLWGSILVSDQAVWISAEFNPLGANVLGSAGAKYIHTNFPGAIVPNTWYSTALADSLAHQDLVPEDFDIRSRFSSDFTFYYGLDGGSPGGRVNFLDVVMHEFGHGLGFQNFEDEASGNFQSGTQDIYSVYTFDNTTGKYWTQMTVAERQASALNYGNVVFTGPNAVAETALVLSKPRTTFHVFAPAPAVADYAVGRSTTFGVPATAANFSGQVVAGLDASNAEGLSTTDGCTAYTNAAAVAGKIALVDRGTCGFVVKAKMAQNAGATGVLIANLSSSTPNNPPAGMSGADATVTIPALLIGYAPGQSLRANLPATVGFLTDATKMNGADNSGRPRLYMPQPVEPGSSGSHYDTAHEPNSLMEPAINTSLRGGLNIDMSAALLKDTGWKLNTGNAKLAGCDTGIKVISTGGLIIGANVEATHKLCMSHSANIGAYNSCMNALNQRLSVAGLITRAQSTKLAYCQSKVTMPVLAKTP